MDSSKTAGTVNRIFTEYLKENKCRCTPERYAILDAIYSINGSFEIPDLLKLLEEKKKFRVSRATVYNTITLLINANLVMHHQFGDKSKYEKCYNTEKSHMVCTQCGKVKEVEANEIISQVMARRYTAFTPAYMSTYLYGLCSACVRQNKKKIKTTK